MNRDKDERSAETIEEQDQTNFVLVSLSSLLFHPMEYVKVLCQLGHEPMAPKWGKNLLGQRRLILPNLFQYMRYIKRTDGFFACFTGVVPSFLGGLASSLVPMKVVNALNLNYLVDDPPLIFVDGDVDYQEYVKYGRREIVIHGISVIVSHPFKVISIRMMAAFVGREEGYRSMFKAISSIYVDNGLSGYFSGLVPRLVGEISCIGSSIVLAYFINKYVVKQKEGRGYVLPTCLFLFSTVTYPLTVVSTCMAVNGSSLLAGNPPRMPLYKSWRDCLSSLIASKQHKRGGSLIFRCVP